MLLVRFVELAIADGCCRFDCAGAAISAFAGCYDASHIYVSHVGVVYRTDANVNPSPPSEGHRHRRNSHVTATRRSRMRKLPVCHFSRVAAASCNKRLSALSRSRRCSHSDVSSVRWSRVLPVPVDLHRPSASGRLARGGFRPMFRTV